MKKSIFILGLTVAMLAGCSETAEPVKVETEVTAEESVETEVEEVEVEEEVVEEQPSEFAVGDTVEIGDLEVTLNSARKSDGDEYSTPEKDFFLVFDVSIQNNGSEPYLVSSMMSFSLSTAEGRSQNMYLFLDGDGQLDGDIAPGKGMAGEIAYDVSQSEYYDLTFLDDPFSADGSFIFTIYEGDIQ